MSLTAKHPCQSRHTLSMSLGCASYQVDLHQFEEAIETLERALALPWSEVRYLCTSIEQLPG